MRKAALLALATALALAQEPTGRVEGRVVDSVTGGPVRGVSVGLFAVSGSRVSRSVISDADGRFVFENVEPGSYGLFAGSLTTRPGKVVKVSTSQTVKDIELRVPVRGSISGRVVDEQERPVPKAMVTCRETVVGSLASTNGNGEFRIESPASGSCLLMAVPIGGEAEIAEERLLTTFYPSATDEAAGIPLVVPAGRGLSGITIVLRKGRLYRVQGTVVAASPGLSLGDVKVFLMPRSRGVFLASAMRKREDGGAVSLSKDGSFDVGQVPPGSYYLRAERKDDSRLVMGRIFFDVHSEDLKGLLLVARDPLRLTGTVKTEGEAELDLSRLSIMLTPVEGVQPPWASSKLSAESTFEMWDLPADDYVVHVSGLPEGAYVKSIHLGARETDGLRLDLSAMEVIPPVEILVSPNGATVEGIVEDDDKPAAGAWVRLVSDPPRPDSTRTSLVGATGRFQFRGLPPGDYRLYALEEAQPEGDPAFFKAFDSRAAKLTLAEGERKQVEVKLS